MTKRYLFMCFCYILLELFSVNTEEEHVNIPLKFLNFWPLLKFITFLL